MILTEVADIEAHVLEYFTNIFTSHAQHTSNELPDQFIPSLVTAQNNELPNHEKIKNAVLSLNGDSTAGPDGFSSHFYQTFWPIVGSDVVKSTQFFFTNNYIMPNLNSNLIILIPKVPGADKLDNITQIALANFQF